MSPEIAYSVGLMASDGCLSKDGRHLDLTSVDIDQLENFSKAIGRSLSIRVKKSGMGLYYHRVQFSDVAYYDFLLGIGLTPNKSKTIPALKIPDEFYPDFLRGLFDADGCFYGYMDKRWRSSLMFYVSYISASMVFTKYLQSMNSKLIGVGNGYIKIGERANDLRYAKADSYKIIDYMYYDKNVICLQRKANKIRHFTDMEQSVILSRHKS